MEKDITSFRLDSMENKIDKLIEKLESMETKLEEKFAGKWTEKVLIFVGGTIGTIIIGALMALIVTR